MSESPNGSYMRIHDGYLINWRTAENPSVLQMVSISEPRELESTSIIEVHKGLRADGTWSLQFILKDPSYRSVFSTFRNDMMENSMGIDPANEHDYVSARYDRWCNIFKKGRSKLQGITLQGLIGEILAVRDVILPRYGEEVALKSWMIGMPSKQDILCNDMWYEVKSRKVGSKTVKISSLDQLDRDDTGRLIVVTLRDSNSTIRSSFTLGSLYDSMMNVLTTDVARNQFEEMMLLAGFDAARKEEYNNDIFELVSITEYSVEGEFPRIRRSSLNVEGIVDAEYDIDLELLDRFEVRSWNLRNSESTCWKERD